MPGPFSDSDLAQLFSIYPDIVRSSATALDKLGPSGTHLASDVVSVPGDLTDLMWRGIGVPRAARQTIVNNNPALATGPTIRAQEANSTYPGIGPAFLRVLAGFVPGAIGKPAGSDLARLLTKD